MTDKPVASESAATSEPVNIPEGHRQAIRNAAIEECARSNPSARDDPNAAGLFALARECGWSEVQSRPAELFILDRLEPSARSAGGVATQRADAYAANDLLPNWEGLDCSESQKKRIAEVLKGWYDLACELERESASRYAAMLAWRRHALDVARELSAAISKPCVRQIGARMPKTKQRNMACAPFIRALKENGWELGYDSMVGGCRTVEFFKFYGRREVQVQLWGDGLHRATHMLYSDRAKRRGRMSTSPTAFNTLGDMWKAIEREVSRMDHPPISAASTTTRQR